MKDACIYSASRQKLKESALRKLAEVSEVQSDAGFLKKPTWFEVKCDTLAFRLNVMPRSELAEHINGFQGYAMSCQEDNPIPNLDEVISYIGNINQAYGMVTDEDFDVDSRLWAILKKIADLVDGVIFVCDSLVDSDGMVIFGPLGEPESENHHSSNAEARRQHIEQQRVKISKEAQSRKGRSIEILKTENVPYIDLPVIETESESTRRTTEEVALRAIALCLVAVKGKGLEQDIIDDAVKDYDIASAFTPKEKKFIMNPNPSKYDRTQFAWRYECYWVMLWALGYIDKLNRPDTICNAEKAVSILRDNSRDDFIKNAKLRPQTEILDAADLIYRYDWAVSDAWINNREAPAGLDSDVVMERHYALNWLIGYMDEAWDDISTDT